jgi:hypothetical protein
MENTTLQPNVLDKSPKRSKFIIFFIISIVIIIAIFGGWRFLSSRPQKATAPAIRPSPTEYQLPKEAPKSPTPEATKTAKPTASPTSEPTVNPVDKSTGLDRSKLTVEVQNGSGVVGAAKKAADALKGLGYVISATGNADNYDYTNVTIQVKSSKSNYLSLLQKDLGSSYTVGTASADLTATSSADALVIVGK